MNLFGSRVFADDPIKMKSLEWDLIQYVCVFIKKSNLYTKTDNQRWKIIIWRHRESAVHEPRNAWGYQKPGERPGTDLPSQLSEVTNPASTLILSFRHPKLWDKSICCLINPVCGSLYGSSRKLIQVIYVTIQNNPTLEKYKIQK